MTDDLDQADALITMSLRAQIAALTRLHDLPLDEVLAVLHAETLMLICQRYGGDVAAECARRAAARLDGLPAACDVALHDMPTRGRA